MLFYLIVSLQGSAQANMGFSETIHFTDYVIGHSHLAMLGFATFASIAGLPTPLKMTDAPYHAGAVNAAYWLTTIGIVVMVSDLTLAGLAQGTSGNRGTMGRHAAGLRALLGNQNPFRHSGTAASACCATACSRAKGRARALAEAGQRSAGQSSPRKSSESLKRCGCLHCSLSSGSHLLHSFGFSAGTAAPFDPE